MRLAVMTTQSCPQASHGLNTGRVTSNRNSCTAPEVLEPPLLASFANVDFAKPDACIICVGSSVKCAED